MKNVALAELLLRRKELQQKVARLAPLTEKDLFEVKTQRKQVNETVDDLTLGTLATYTYGGYSIYGFTNFPGRITKSMTLPTALMPQVWSQYARRPPRRLARSTYCSREGPRPRMAMRFGVVRPVGGCFTSTWAPAFAGVVGDMEIAEHKVPHQSNLQLQSANQQSHNKVRALLHSLFQKKAFAFLLPEQKWTPHH